MTNCDSDSGYIIVHFNVLKELFNSYSKCKQCDSLGNTSVYEEKCSRRRLSCKLNVCLFQCQTHCTIMRFGFRTRRIDGIKHGLFSNHATLGQTTLRVGRVSV